MKTLTLAKHAALGAALLSTGAPLLHAQDVQIAPGTTASIQFMNGGVGESERASIRKAGAAFKLRVELSERADNELVADAALKITDMKGQPVLDLAQAGPIVNVNVPNGTYRVDASLHGQTESRVVTLRGRDRANLYFHWVGSPKAATS
ncbi:MAG TPA: hypothetical protein VGO85_02350 [Caldimonas sp.]|jgi:hypothetical protein|nr:hypothetical protein [Caldimonas sp.]